MSRTCKIIEETTNYDVLLLPTRRNETSPLSGNNRENDDEVNSIASLDFIYRKENQEEIESPSSIVPFQSLTSSHGQDCDNMLSPKAVVDAVEFYDPNHAGNNRFMVQISLHKDDFQKAFSQKNSNACEKIIQTIVRIVTEKCRPKGRFLEIVGSSGWNGEIKWKDLGTGMEVRERVERILLNPPNTPITAALEGHKNVYSMNNFIEPTESGEYDQQKHGASTKNEFEQNLLDPLFDDDQLPNSHMQSPKTDFSTNTFLRYQVRPNFDSNAFRPRVEVDSSHEDSTVNSTNPSIDNFSASTMRSANNRAVNGRSRRAQRGPIKRFGEITSARDTSQITKGMMDQVQLDSYSDNTFSEMTESLYSHSSEHDSFRRSIPGLSSVKNIGLSCSAFPTEIPSSKAISQELDLDPDKVRVFTIHKTVESVGTYDVLSETNPYAIKSTSCHGFFGNNRIRIMMEMNEESYFKADHRERSNICNDIYSNVCSGAKGQGRFLVKTGQNEYREVHLSEGVEIIDQIMKQVVFDGTKHQNAPKSKMTDDLGDRHRFNARQALQSRKNRNEKRKQTSMGLQHREEIQRKMMDVAKQEIKA